MMYIYALSLRSFNNFCLKKMFIEKVLTVKINYNWLIIYTYKIFKYNNLLNLIMYSKVTLCTKKNKI
jgi:hypothetical protein